MTYNLLSFILQLSVGAYIGFILFIKWAVLKAFPVVMKKSSTYLFINAIILKLSKVHYVNQIVVIDKTSVMNFARFNFVDTLNKKIKNTWNPVEGWSCTA